MNTRKTAPLIAIVSLAALLSGVTGAAHARVMVDDAPTAVDAQGARLLRDVSFERTEAIRSAKQAEARLAAPQAVSFERAEAIRAVKQAEATEHAGSGIVDDFLSPLQGDR